MDRNHRIARAINMRKAPPRPRIRPAPTPDSVLADLDAIDAVTTDPTIHYAADRCAGHWADTSDQAPLLVRAAHARGKGGWLTGDHRAGALLDQAWHKGWVAVAAAIAAGPRRSG